MGIVMGKEFIWGSDFKAVLDDGVCTTYENGVMTNRLPFDTAKSGLQLDEVIEVRGQRVRFQLENGVPYLQLDGKWVASDTTIAERKLGLLESEKRSSRMLALIGVLLITFAGVMGLMRPGSMRYWLVAGLVGVTLIVNGIIQYSSVKKKLSA